MKITATYIKLQDAYVSESNKIGSWTLVGYVAPGASSASDDSPSTTNFTYYGSGDFTSGAIDIADQSDAWVAKNIPALNDCAAGNGKWNIDIKANSNGNSVSYEAETTCEQLTPSFTKIGK